MKIPTTDFSLLIFLAFQAEYANDFFLKKAIDVLENFICERLAYTLRSRVAEEGNAETRKIWIWSTFRKMLYPRRVLFPINRKIRSSKLIGSRPLENFLLAF